MDPQACFAILAGAAAQHSLSGGGGCGCGAVGRTRFCHLGVDCTATPSPDVGGSAAGGAEEAPADVEAPPPPPAPWMSRAAAMLAQPEDVGRGQVIDMETGRNETVALGMSEATILELFPELKAPPPASGDDGVVPAKVEDVTARKPSELLRAFVAVHEARVSVHRAYDAAFRHLLLGKGGGAQAVARTYPFVVAHASARFQELSGAAREAAELLEAAATGADADKSSAEEIAGAARVVRKVQGLEQARLQLVAMHHLEQSQMQTLGGGDQENAGRLRQQLGSTAESIEELVSELKYAIAELVELGS